MVTETIGTILEREGGTFRVSTDQGEFTAILRGKVKHRDGDRYVVGDRVRVDTEDPSGTLGIISAEPRRNLLERRSPDSRRARPVAANLDRVLVFTAAANPEPLPQLLDRLLVIAEANDIPAGVVVNKCDLASPEPIATRFERIGYPVWRVSVKNGLGVEAVLAEVKGHVTLFTGPSGSGKSSLLNRLQPGLALRTSATSAKVGRGRHTTVSAVMAPLAMGGYLVDTPGFSDVGLWGIDPRGLMQCFPEMRPLIDQCKFADCHHLIEPHCAVRAAVADGTIDAGRYESYRILLGEIRASPEQWE